MIVIEEEYMAIEKKTKKSRLEIEYEELFKIKLPSEPLFSPNVSLEQPSQLKIIQSVVTYGAYEDPI